MLWLQCPAVFCLDVCDGWMAAMAIPGRTEASSAVREAVWDHKDHRETNLQYLTCSEIKHSELFQEEDFTAS